MAIVVPPGGFAGYNQMTPASRAALRVPGQGSTGRRRRSKKRKAAPAAKRKRAGGRKIKFGSPAWRKKYKLGKARRKK